ncbi:uncharacterized protein LOC133206217 [Saccostrea echinata]|uniref:uncharacterized protein LOC133206217 n=1 Tax=Saccostrea echinata TaxID=191078 RepID=UPI002A8072CC|nr:uncharacterized protein LOC133206217 [Saccostrea echinata]
MNLTGVNFSSGLVRDTQWSYSWKLLVFVSVFLCIFLVIGVTNGLLFIHYRKRTIKLLDVFLLVIYIEITNLCSILSLVLLLFESVSQYSDLVRSLSFPFLINCFCLTQVIILRLTRLDVRPIQYNGIKCVLLTTCGMILLAITLQILKSITCFDMNLMTLSDIFFICYAFYHMICFILSAPKLSKYTKELRNVKREISIHTLSKRNYSSRESSMKRVKAPRLRNCGNLVKLVSDSESSECLTEQTKSSTVEYSTCRHISLYRWVSKSSACNFTKEECKYESVKRTSDTNLFDELNGESFALRNQRDCEGIPNCRKGHRSMSFPREGSDSAPLTLKIPRSCCNLHKSDTLGVNDLEFKHNISPASSNSSGITRISRRNLGSGYVADSEVISMNSDCSDKNQPLELLFPSAITLPNSLSFLSFYRVQQGRLLHRLLYLCYTLTVVLCVASLIKVCRVYNFWKQKINEDIQKQLTLRFFDRMTDACVVLLTTSAVRLVVQHRTNRRRKTDTSKTETNSVT